VASRRPPVLEAIRHGRDQRHGRTFWNVVAPQQPPRRPVEVKNRKPFNPPPYNHRRPKFNWLISLTRRISLAGHEAISYHPAHTYTDGSSQCELPGLSCLLFESQFIFVGMNVYSFLLLDVCRLGRVATPVARISCKLRLSSCEFKRKWICVEVWVVAIFVILSV
jgi:hypothetical protein